MELLERLGLENVAKHFESKPGSSPRSFFTSITRRPKIEAVSDLNITLDGVTYPG